MAKLVVLNNDGTRTTLESTTISSSVVINEIELDFGTTPINTKKFIVVDASITTLSKIIMTPSGNIGTSRIGDDWEWDSISTVCKSGTGSFTVTAKATGKIKGKRKFFYTFS